MASFFENLDPDRAAELEELSRLAYELRENHKRVLEAHGAQEEAALLERIASGKLAEHPGYEHYLAARILDATRATARATLAERLRGGGTNISTPHLELAAMLAAEFAERLAAAPELRQDALIVHLNNGVTLYVRYAAADAYSLRWRETDAELDQVPARGIDTAPLHRALATFPNHLHTGDGRVLADPVTRIDTSPRDNLRALMRVLLDDPTFAATASAPCP